MSKRLPIAACADKFPPRELPRAVLQMKALSGRSPTFSATKTGATAVVYVILLIKPEMNELGFESSGLPERKALSQVRMNMISESRLATLVSASEMRSSTPFTTV